jgi:hypothetical protein
VHGRLIEDYRAFTTAFVEIDDARVKPHVADRRPVGEAHPARSRRCRRAALVSEAGRGPGSGRGFGAGFRID